MSVHPKLIWNTRKLRQYVSRDIVYVNGPTLKNGKMQKFDFLKVAESMKIRKIAF